MLPTITFVFLLVSVAALCTSALAPGDHGTFAAQLLIEVPFTSIFPRLDLALRGLTSNMSVAYEPRNFINEGAYPPMGDEPDHTDQRFTDRDVAEHLSHYTTEAGMLPDDRDVMGDDRGMLPEDAAAVQDATRLDLTADTFPSPIHVPLPSSHLPDPLPESKDPSPGADSNSSRPKGMPKPDRDVMKQADGKFHCPLPDCKEDSRAFSRKCEWK